MIMVPVILVCEGEDCAKQAQAFMEVEYVPRVVRGRGVFSPVLRKLQLSQDPRAPTRGWTHEIVPQLLAGPREAPAQTRLLCPACSPAKEQEPGRKLEAVP